MHRKPTLWEYVKEALTTQFAVIIMWFIPIWIIIGAVLLDDASRAAWVALEAGIVLLLIGSVMTVLGLGIGAQRPDFWIHAIVPLWIRWVIGILMVCGLFLGR